MANEHIQQKIDGKLKPVGALGKIESLAFQLASIQQTNKVTLANPTMLVFAADHGISKHGISIAPNAVTSIMVNSFLNNHAAINCFSNTLGWHLSIVDCGTLTELAHDNLISARIAPISGDISQQDAMSEGQLAQCKANAKSIIERVQGDVIGFGEMGIGNSAVAAAIFAKLYGFSAHVITGKGTGVNDEILVEKIALVDKAVNRAAVSSPEEIMQKLGGFEINTMAYSMIYAFQANKVILVDGFISTAAAALAVAMAPDCLNNMVFSHVSKEPGHGLVLKQLGVSALLDLNLGLGEGTGAALALPFLQCAASMYNDMASFDDLGLTL